MEPTPVGVGGTVERWRAEASRAFQHYLDRAALHMARRWAGTLVAATVYALRVYFVQGFYVVTYTLGIYLLNLLIGFLSPPRPPPPARPGRGTSQTAAAPAPAGSRNSIIDRIHQAAGGIHDNDTNLVRIRQLDSSCTSCNRSSLTSENKIKDAERKCGFYEKYKM